MDGADLRVKVVGEGGNLGVTQLGRIEFARAGGRINTDAIDNSAGVDTSDHEVNIKIALQYRMERGDLDEPGRLALLSSMTDEVADLVLADNRGQNRVLGASRLHAPVMLSVHARLIDALVESGRLDRALEFLPTHAQINARLAAGEGLAGPELCVLLAYVKAGLSAAMLARSTCPTIRPSRHRLPEYFPRADAGRLGGRRAAITAHPLAREIVTTETVNEMVNRAGHLLRVPARGGDGGHPERRHPRLHDRQHRLRPAAACGGRWRRWTTRRPRTPRTRSSCGRAGCWTGPLAGCSPSAPSRWTCGPRSSGTWGRSST